MYTHAMYVLIYSGTYCVPCLRTYELHEFDRVECDENMHEKKVSLCLRISSELTWLHSNGSLGLLMLYQWSW